MMVQGGRGKKAALQILAISQSFQVGLEWCQKQMWNPRKFCKNFENWASNHNFCSPYKNSEMSQQKSRKCVFQPFLNRHQKKLIYSLLLIRQKYYEFFKTEYSDSTFFINRLTPLFFFSGDLDRKGPPGSLHGPNWPIFLHRSLDNEQT